MVISDDLVQKKSESTMKENTSAEKVGFMTFFFVYLWIEIQNGRSCYLVHSCKNPACSGWEGGFKFLICI